jgi:hypothetical protein
MRPTIAFGGKPAQTQLEIVVGSNTDGRSYNRTLLFIVEHSTSRIFQAALEVIRMVSQQEANVPPTLGV